MTRNKIADELRTAVIEARKLSSPIAAFGYLERAVEWTLHDLVGDELPPTNKVEPTAFRS